MKRDERTHQINCCQKHTSTQHTHNHAAASHTASVSHATNVVYNSFN